MTNENMDFSFIKDEAGVTNVEQKENTITISKSEFIEKTSEVSKQILKDLENKIRESGKEFNTMMLMSEMLTHAILLAKITGELFNGGNE